MSTTAQIRARREQRKRLGLCIWCAQPKPRDPEAFARAGCPDCRKAIAEYSKLKYRALVLTGSLRQQTLQRAA